jgi:hypothetical protein
MLAEAIENAEIAFRQFEFSIRLLSYAELGKIEAAEFGRDHITRLHNGTIRFSPETFSDDAGIWRAANINVVMTFAASAIALNDAFEAAAIKVDVTATDSDSRIRTLVHMVRCAHAHRIAEPHWEARGKYARLLIVDVDGIGTLHLDLPSLHQRPFDVESIGGYVGWYRIANGALRQLRERDAKRGELAGVLANGLNLY